LFLGTRKSFDHLISDTKAPKRQDMESGITTPPKMRRVAKNDYEMGEKQDLHFQNNTNYKCFVFIYKGLSPNSMFICLGYYKVREKYLNNGFWRV